MTNKKVMAWHFTAATLREGHPIPPIGETLKHTGRLVICASGLHASLEPFDALQYAPGAMLHRVECVGMSRTKVAREHKDKIVCRQRTIVASIDATPLLRRFACDQAIEALRITATEPTPIVAKWLETMDESIRASAWASARASAWESAWESARASALESAWASARASAKASAMASAWESAMASAWESARASAWASARASAWAFARESAWESAWESARKDFNAQVYAAFGVDR